MIKFKLNKFGHKIKLLTINYRKRAILQANLAFLYSIIIILFIFSESCSKHSPQQQNNTTKDDFLEIHFINVGYGEAILLKTAQNKAILWDAGYAEKGAEVCSYLKRQKVQNLDIVINSHPHPDHIGGLPTVLATFPIKKVWGSHPLDASEMSEEFRKIISKKRLSYKLIRRGYIFQWTKAITFKFLNPKQIVRDLNDSSLVVIIKIGSKKLLLTADIGPKIQRELIEIYSKELKCDLMTVPHHGGILLPDFLKVVSPSILILSVGVNRWGRPRNETLNLISTFETKLYRTDQYGSIIFHIPSNGQITLNNPSNKKISF